GIRGSALEGILRRRLDRRRPSAQGWAIQLLSESQLRRETVPGREAPDRPRRVEPLPGVGEPEAFAESRRPRPEDRVLPKRGGPLHPLVEGGGEGEAGRPGDRPLAQV